MSRHAYIYIYIYMSVSTAVCVCIYEFRKFDLPLVLHVYDEHFVALSHFRRPLASSEARLQPFAAP